MKKDLLIILLVLAVVIGMVYYAQKNVDKRIKEPTLIQDVQSQDVEQKKPLIQTQAHQNEKNIQTEHTTEASQSSEEDNSDQPLFAILSNEEVHLITTPRKNVPYIAAVRLNSSFKEQIRIGEIIQLPDIEGIDYEITIKDVQKNTHGLISATGSFTDENIKYTSTITSSKEHTYITLSTPHGIYEIETNNDVGYIYRSDMIKKQMFKPTKSDVHILPIPKKPLTDTN